MTILNKISAMDTKVRVDSGMALLVCIYDDNKFNSEAHLAGAVPMSEFERMKPDLSKDTEIIFY